MPENVDEAIRLLNEAGKRNRDAAFSAALVKKDGKEQLAIIPAMPDDFKQKQRVAVYLANAGLTLGKEAEYDTNEPRILFTPEIKIDQALKDFAAGKNQTPPEWQMAHYALNDAFKYTPARFHFDHTTQSFLADVTRMDREYATADKVQSHLQENEIESEIIEPETEEGPLKLSISPQSVANRAKGDRLPISVYEAQYESMVELLDAAGVKHRNFHFNTDFRNTISNGRIYAWGIGRVKNEDVRIYLENSGVVEIVNPDYDGQICCEMRTQRLDSPLLQDLAEGKNQAPLNYQHQQWELNKALARSNPALEFRYSDQAKQLTATAANEAAAKTAQTYLNHFEITAKRDGTKLTVDPKTLPERGAVLDALNELDKAAEKQGIEMRIKGLSALTGLSWSQDGDKLRSQPLTGKASEIEGKIVRNEKLYEAFDGMKGTVVPMLKGQYRLETEIRYVNPATFEALVPQAESLKTILGTDKAPAKPKDREGAMHGLPGLKEAAQAFRQVAAPASDALANQMPATGKGRFIV